MEEEYGIEVEYEFSHKFNSINVKDKTDIIVTLEATDYNMKRR